ncbi:hypothetical protein AB0D65_09315 [Streptomyces griseoloalbus]|uniref:Uncharacterized protein n=1 Tax=Streptomyces griseoloalbus TaxID=67303 RepID=A0ABV3E225_9ACTN
MATGHEALRAYELLVHDTRVPAVGDSGTGQLRLEFSSDTQLPELIEALRHVFAAAPELDSVLLVPDGQPVGSTARIRFQQQVPEPDGCNDELSVRGGLGAGDHGTLPGAPTRFTVYRYRCGRCEHTSYRIAADEAPPLCPAAGHGEMRMDP